MRKDAAPQRRRDLNIRLDKRPGLPIPAVRIQPQAVKNNVITNLGKLLAWRTGWHGLEAASGKRLFFVVRHLSETYVLDLERCRVPEGWHIKGDYKITDSMVPLGKFELLFTDDAVSEVYSFQVEGSGPLAAAGAMAATGAMVDIQEEGTYAQRHGWMEHGHYKACPIALTTGFDWGCTEALRD